MQFVLVKTTINMVSYEFQNLLGHCHYKTDWEGLEYKEEKNNGLELEKCYRNKVNVGFGPERLK